MGRDKSQRTKGNVKPASSGRTAELLFPNANASTSSGFGTGSTLFTSGLSGATANSPNKPKFQSLTSSTAFVPILDDTLEPRLAIPLRKLGKKDPTTKIKALEELIALCKDDSSVPEQILPFYPTIFNKLSTDESKKVRELAQSLLQSIGTSVGRTLATQLKQLLPSWYLGINDTYPPASSIAEHAFKTIFPTEEKQLQALKFSLIEICSVVKERLSSSLEFDKITGLAGLKKLLPLVDNDYIFDILKQDQFWTLGKDDSSQIRGSFYSLLCTLGETHSTLIPKSKLTKALSLALKEEKVELSLLWNCFLTLTMHDIFNEKEAAFKELLVLCKNSFYGNANHLGPLVLPLIDKIGDVGEDLFEALEQGFGGAISNLERLAIIRTYAEALAYYLKPKEGETLVIPPTILPFLTQNLKPACEFGRTFAPLMKTSNEFYEQMVEFCTEESVSSREFGLFVLSFLQKKKSVSFEKGDQQEGAPTSSIIYWTLPENKKNFAQNISRKCLHFKGYRSFSVISRSLKCAEFYEDILDHDLKKIPVVFNFSPVDVAMKIDVLRVSLDLVELFPTLPTTLLLFSTVYDTFFSSGNLEILDEFIQELHGFDELKPIKSWLKMDIFTKQNSLSSLKYILRKGTATFPTNVVQEKLKEACDSFHVEVVRDLLLTRPQIKTDLSELYLKTWDLYLEEKTEDLEQLCILILEKDVLSSQILYDKLLNTGTSLCTSVEQVNHLVDYFAVKIYCDKDLLHINPIDSHMETVIDSDFLVFHGFKYPRLKYASSLSSPPLLFHPLAAIKKVIFEAKLGLAISMNEDELIQVGINLLFVQCLYNIWEDGIGKNIWNPSKKVPIQFLSELSACQSKVIEIIVGTRSTRQAFWNQLIKKSENEVWASRYPLKHFLQLARKMELTCFSIEPTSFNNLDNIESIFHNYLVDSSVSGAEVIPMIEELRKDHAEQFQFEKLYFYVESDGERQRMFDLLALTIELMRRNRSGSFLSTGTCWISAWIKMSKNISYSKTNYLWLIELSRAVILIDELVKETKSDFVQEYVEFHAGNLYPNIYTWLSQLFDSNAGFGFDYWRLKCCEKVVMALSRVPKSILTNSIEQDSSKVFEAFMPMLKKEESAFKINAFKIMRKVVIKDDIIIPKELLEYLEETMNDFEDEIDGEDEDETDNSENEGYGKLGNDNIVTYLLAWDTLLTTQPNTADLSNFVKADNLLPKLLSLLFQRLIPKHPKQYFENELLKLSSNIVPSIPHLSCHVLHHLLSCLPYTARWWWSGLAKQRDKVHVDKIITKYLSGKLAAEELGKVKLEGSSDNITVMSHPGCNELVARYRFEETSITLTISLPLNYPLGPLTVQVSDSKLHARISQLLNTRTHSLSAGLKLWKESLDDTYKDVDECTICFYVIHHATKQLPKLECRTCKKRFHAACLYKWFSTSNKSECPLCKSLW